MDSSPCTDIHPDNILIRPKFTDSSAVEALLSSPELQSEETGPIPFPLPDDEDFLVTLIDLEAGV